LPVLLLLLSCASFRNVHMTTRASRPTIQDLHRREVTSSIAHGANMSLTPLLFNCTE
jgi:hypothetical protein